MTERSTQNNDSIVTDDQERLPLIPIGSLSSKEFSYAGHQPILNDASIDRIPSMQEFFTLVWYNPGYDGGKNDIETMSHLSGLYDNILFYKESRLCLEYLSVQSQANENCVMVIHGLEHALKMYDFECVQAIFIIIFEDISGTWLDLTKRYPKLCGFSRKIEGISGELQTTVRKIERQAFIQNENNSTKVISLSERSMRDVQQETAPFFWCHVFKIMIMALPKSLDARQEMIEECRSSYQGNQVALNNVDTFDLTYQSSDAISWYTRSTFLYRLVNRALRKEDVTALYTFRYYIADLCSSLETVMNSSKKIAEVYRGSIIALDEIEKYRIGDLVSSNGFFSCSSELSVAQAFISWDASTNTTPSRSRTDKNQFVIFKIKLDHILESNTVVADVSNFSPFPDEKEVLFTLGTVFDIVAIDYQADHYLWYIELQPSIKLREMTADYEKYIRERMAETKVNILFGILLTDLGDYERSKDYFERVLERIPRDHEDRANALYSLARVHRFTGQYEQALRLFEETQQLQHDCLPSSTFDLARTLAGIGSTYCELHNHQQELFYYKQALDLYIGILPSYHIELASTYNRLGYAYYNLRSYEKALEYCQQSVITYDHTVPDFHPSKAQPLENVGLSHIALGHREQGRDFLEQALKIREKSLPSDHLHLAESYYYLGVFHAEDHEQHDRALTFAQRALEIRTKKLPDHHELVRKAKDLVEKLQ